MKNKTVLMLLAAIAILGAVATFAPWPFGKTASLYQLRPDDARVVAEGARIYETHCASCHGAQLEGQPEWRSRNAAGMLPAPPHDASGHTWHHPDELLFRITKLGVAAVIGDKDYKTAMPAFGDVLSDGQIIAALSWIKAQWPAEVRKDNDLVNAQSR
jgi:S-disulfanyl-L-cysteine oxidoreductase SoxD